MMMRLKLTGNRLWAPAVNGGDFIHNCCTVVNDRHPKIKCLCTTGGARGQDRAATAKGKEGVK